ncbi:MAG: (deoxy)nucleoside triphosphate pyrophosphohydrolase, partial [Pseudomonadota bacterium]
MSLIIVSAAALIDRDGRVMMTTRPAGKDHEGLHEFPGGKVEQGEMPETALIRELNEELSISTEESCLAPFGFATEKREDELLLMTVFVCRKWKGHPKPLEGQKIVWARPQQLLDLPMPP